MEIVKKYQDIVSNFKHLQTLETFKNSKSDIVRKKVCVFQDTLEYIEDEKHGDNTLYVSRLFDLYKDIISELFGFDPEEHLKSLLAIFEELYPLETCHIREYLETYKFLNLTRDKILLKGDIQSGKTAMMILTAMCYLACNRDIVFIVRNKNDDKHQLKSRFEQFVRDLKVKKSYENKNFRIIGKNDTPPTDANCVFIEIYRKDNIDKLSKLLKRRNPVSTVLFVDEADSRDDIKDSEFIDLCNITGTNVLVSATVQDILVSKWGVRGDTIIPLFTNSSYRGIDKLRFTVRDDLNEKDGLFWTFCDIAIDTDYLQVRPEHPKVLLISVDRLLEKMDNLYDQFRMNRFEIGPNDQPVHLPKEMQDICVIEYTGKGIRMYHNSLTRHDNFPNKKEFKNGQFVFKPQVMTIKDVLLWLARNGGKQRFPNIVIISGDMASRGINFACWDAFNPQNNWHITHQILVKSEKSTCSTIIQACRILGNHGDEIPLKLYTTKECEEKIRKGSKLTRELVDCITNDEHPLHNPGWKGRPTHEICSEIPLRKSDKPEKFLAKKSEKKFFKLVGDDEIAIPLDWEYQVRDNERGEYYCILFEKLSSSERKVYNYALDYLEDKRNVWIPRSEIVNHAIGLGEDEFATKARLKDICLKSDKNFKTDSENQIGLLFKKVLSRWHIRLN